MSLSIHLSLFFQFSMLISHKLSTILTKYETLTKMVLNFGTILKIQNENSSISALKFLSSLASKSWINHFRIQVCKKIRLFTNIILFFFFFFNLHFMPPLLTTNIYLIIEMENYKSNKLFLSELCQVFLIFLKFKLH